ncbi:PadR family transcriptional regulator [Pseudonocardia lacus]|uniref:PadR family transcriptional regulator n=1 Tax=Pseudonocardia lacus TaxID=2835865 RepID=UPI001BDD0A9A|nr:PadR family transcriptional regulator [Pseudonocardia lacus]
MELHRSDRDLPALTVLALLLTGPRHAYEMHRLILDTHKDFVTGLPRSMYHAVDRLLRDGLIEVHDVRREGPRPERTVYALTDAGRAALTERVGRLLAVPDADATLLVAALSFVGALARQQALIALRARLDALDARLHGLAEGLATVPAAVPRLLLVESEFERARLEAERAWVAAFADDVEAGSLAWPGEDDAAFAGLADLLPAGPDGEPQMG